MPGMPQDIIEVCVKFPEAVQLPAVVLVVAAVKIDREGGVTGLSPEMTVCWTIQRSIRFGMLGT